MEHPETPTGLGTVRRRAVDHSQLVETSTVGGRPMPLVVRPSVEGVDLSEWIEGHHDEVVGYLDRHGAIMFRGFGLRTAQDFERAAAAVSPDLFADYGDLPNEPAGERIYSSTPYPADKTILFHNESSHLPQWPLRQFFFCVTAAQEGGITPLLDGRDVYRELDPAIVEEFERKGLRYVRNFSPGIDVPWQDFFGTSDRAEVERSCRESGMSCEWTGDDSLRISQVSPAVVTHPRTGEKVWFNQVQLHHVYCLDPETRESLRMLFAEEDLPRTVYFGDGSQIPDDAMERIGETYEELCVEMPWDEGDMIALDNMLVAHARRPFVGPRKILVAMAEMVRADDLNGA
jgi:alpha-ketoglutarate-dependent taurine dioxygenase